MIEPKRAWKKFKNDEEKIEKLKKWNLISSQAQEIKTLYYKGTYTNDIEECDVIGYVDDNEIIISINNKIHSIHPEYLVEMQKKEKFIIVDIETPMSFRPEDGIREVSAIAVEDYKIVDSIHLAVIEDEQKYLQGYGKGLKPIENDDVQKALFKAFITKHKSPLIAHNATFDRSFLGYWGWVDPDTDFYCSMLTIKRLVKLESYKLDYLLGKYNIKNEQKHNALDDVLDLFELLMIFRPKKWYKLDEGFYNKEKSEEKILLNKKISYYKKADNEKEILEDAKKNIIKDIFNKDQIVFTGIMSLKRIEMQTLAIKYGATVRNSVTKNTDLLVVGTEPGNTKIKQARQYNVKLISEKEFIKYIDKFK